MAYRLSAISLGHAIDHLQRYGDTDVFPHLPELSFLSQLKDDIVDELSQLDLDVYNPGGAIEALAPKSRFGFRVVHQLTATDTVLMLACVIEIGSLIEARRQPISSICAFSYRFHLTPDGKIFGDGRTYRDWLHAQADYVDLNLEVAAVISTDISDFYSRINFHRLDNLLDDACPGSGAARFLKKQIKMIRARQSFGLPVGGAAARLLAELSLVDTDAALVDQGIKFTRFVDDYRIFLDGNEDPYDVLGFLAEHLGINEGLSLNASKTSLASREEFLTSVRDLTRDVDAEADDAALASLTAEIYFGDAHDEEDLNALRHLNLLQFLREEVARPHWDLGRIKLIFRALRIARPEEAIDYINRNFRSLIVFSKELCLLMEVLDRDNIDCFDHLIDEVIEAILSPPATSVQTLRTWLLEIFVRSIIVIPLSKLRRLDALSSASDRRQLALIRGRRRDINYFRRNKTAIHTFAPSEAACIVWGASCLPVDEYTTWLGTIRHHFDRPLGTLFLRWARENRALLIDNMPLVADFDDP